MSNIIILDFSTTEVHVFPYDNHVWESGEDFIAQDPYELGLKESNCQYMIVEELNIKIH